MTVTLRRAAGLALWTLVIAIGAAIVASGETAGQGMNRAGLMIEFPDGRTETRCIEFSEETITGAELLRRSGLPVVFSGFGGLGSGVCRIDDVGCADPNDCFCQCRGASCAYWSYWTVRDGEWRYQNVGASDRTVRDGDIDAWVWGNGRDAPDDASFDALCAPPTPTRPPRATSTLARPTSLSVPAPTARASGPPGARAQPTEPSAPSVPLATPDARATAEITPGKPAPGSTRASESLAAVRRGGSETGGGSQESEVATDDGNEGAGVPVSLLAFGAVAGLIAAAGGALAWRSRTRGD
jgi:hypothetical protein